jgi:hypothetical protein
MKFSVWMSGSGPDIENASTTAASDGGSGGQRPGPDGTGSSSGGQSAVEPPGPIPNPEVKRCSADGIGTTGPVRVGRRQVFARHPQQCGCRALFLCPEQAHGPPRDTGPNRHSSALKEVQGSSRALEAWPLCQLRSATITAATRGGGDSLERRKSIWIRCPGPRVTF